MLVMAGRWFRVCCVSILKTVMQQDNLMICPFLLSRLLLVIPNLFSSLLFSSLPFHCPYRATETRQKASIPIDISLQNRL